MVVRWKKAVIWWRKARPFLIGAGRLAGAILVAYAFAVVLMTASLQAHVAEGLAKITPRPLEYSTGYTMWKESQGIDGQIAQLRRRRDEAAQAREKAETNAREAGDELRVLAPQLRVWARRLNGCRIELGDPDPEQIAGAVAGLRQCAAELQLSEVNRRELDGVIDSPSVLQNVRALQLALRSHARQDRAFQEAHARIAELGKERDKLVEPREAFDAISVLERRWMIGGGALTELPPTIVQILLAVVSGMFGALLLTMIFVVYPDNDLRLTTSRASYASRVLLGGLISLCVFVVLGAGTAVLGTSSALAEGTSNFLALCAIGILAGMFSDLVADWLWNRAKNFFGEPHGASGQAQAPHGAAVPAAVAPGS